MRTYVRDKERWGRTPKLLVCTPSTGGIPKVFGTLYGSEGEALFPTVRLRVYEGSEVVAIYITKDHRSEHDRRES